MTNPHMTSAQAAQQNNRDQGGRYATKQHMEADFTPPPLPDSAANEAEEVRRRRARRWHEVDMQIEAEERSRNLEERRRAAKDALAATAGHVSTVESTKGFASLRRGAEIRRIDARVAMTEQVSILAENTTAHDLVRGAEKERQTAADNEGWLPLNGRGAVTPWGRAARRREARHRLTAYAAAIQMKTDTANNQETLR